MTEQEWLASVDAMTEQDWLASTNPKELLAFVRETASDRKYRLFSAACCRRIWHLLTDAQYRMAVEVAERFADGLVTEDERERAYEASFAIRSVGEGAANYAVSASPREGALWTIDTAIQAAAFTTDEEYDPSRWDLECREQCVLIRDIFSNLFRCVEIESTVLTWNDGTVPKIAGTIYDERSFHDMPILADALEEAGCANADILGHCRGDGPHVRGCWVVDLILGKE